MALLLALAYIFVGILIAVWSASVDKDSHIQPLVLVAFWPPIMLGFAAFCFNDYILELGKRLRK